MGRIEKEKKELLKAAADKEKEYIDYNKETLKMLKNCISEGKNLSNEPSILLEIIKRNCDTCLKMQEAISILKICSSRKIIKKFLQSNKEYYKKIQKEATDKNRLNKDSEKNI